MIKISSIASVLFAGLVFFTGCVPMKKFNDAQQALASARYDSAKLATKVGELQSNIAQLNQVSAAQKATIDSQARALDEQRGQIATLSQQVADLKGQINQLQTDAANKNSLLSKSKQDHWLRKAQLADQWLRFNPESPYVQS